MTRTKAPRLTDGAIVDGRFRIAELLGSGGMGSVYRAHDLEQDREIALKVLKNLDRDQHLIRFKREFRAASRLTHPGCVGVYSLGKAENCWYITMECVDGTDLKSVEGVDRVKTAVGIALQALAALDHIHSKRVIHRDIKPQNILCADTAVGIPRVKLTDFGISKLGNIEEQMGIGVLIGSLPYLAPEVIDERQVDPRSDLYALGIVIYQMLSGHHPYAPVDLDEAWSPTPTEWLRLHRSGVPSDLRATRPDVAAPVADVIMKMISRRPDERYSMAALAHDELSAWWVSAGDDPLPAYPSLDRTPYLTPPRFVGREPERAIVQRFITDTVHRANASDERPNASLDVPYACVIEAPAGAGKSRLVSFLPKMCEEQGVGFIAGTCRAEPGAAYEPLRALLRSIGVSDDSVVTKSRGESVSVEEYQTGEVTVLDTPAASVPQSLGAPTSTVDDVATIVEEARLEFESSASGGELPGGLEMQENARWRFQRSIADRVVALASSHPIVLLLEDAHWADGPTLQLLEFVMRTVESLRQEGQRVPLGIVITQRPAEDHAALADLRTLLREYDAAEEIRLAPLDASAIAEMVASMLAIPSNPTVEDFSELVAEATEGNPLRIVQILHALLASGRLDWTGTAWALEDLSLDAAAFLANVHSAVGDRAARFSIETKLVLAAASIIGRQSTLRTLERTTGLDEGLLLDCLDEAIRAAFLNETGTDGGIYRFTHDRIRDAIIERIPAEQARALHADVAQVLIEDHGDSPPYFADIAYHTRQSGMRDEAIRYATRAARHAMSRYAFVQGAQLYESAIEMRIEANRPVSMALLERSGEACLQAGRYDAAREKFARLLQTLDDPVERSETLRKSAEVEFRRGDNRRAQTLLEDALESVGFFIPQRRSILVLLLIWRTLAVVLQLPRLRQRLALSKVSPAEHVVARISTRLAEAYYFSDFSKSAFYQLTAVNVSERIGPSRELTVSAAQQGYVLSLFGLSRSSKRYLDRARECGQLAATPVEQAWERIMRAEFLLCCGDAHGAAEATRQAEALLEKSSEPLRVRQAWTIHAEALLAVGHASGALQTGYRVRKLAEQLDDHRGRGWAFYVLGHAHHRLGNRDRAISMLRDGLAFSERAGDPVYGITTAARLAVVLTLAGRADEALEVARPAMIDLVRRRLRNPTCTIHGAFLIATAAAVQAGHPLDSSLRGDVRVALRAGKWFSRAMKFPRPLFECGRAAWAQATGESSETERRFDTAARIAQELRLSGEAEDVERLRRYFSSIAANSEKPKTE